MKNKIDKKGSSKILNVIITFILLITFFLIIVVIFFGDLLPQAFEKVKNLINDVPEIDQEDSEMDFVRNNDIQLKFLSSWTNLIKNAIEGPATKGGCIIELTPLDQEGFYLEGSNYNLHIEQKDENIVFKLTKYAKQEYEEDEDKIETPITTTIIKGTQLCIINGTEAVNFYDEFMDMEENDVPDFSKINPVPITSLLISSGKEENNNRKVGYAQGTPQTEEDYVWETLFKKGDKTIIYAVRLQKSGLNYICFFPTVIDTGLRSQCGGPKDGLIQTDCFDKDGKDEKSIKYNINNNLISSEYICSVISSTTTETKI